MVREIERKREKLRKRKLVRVSLWWGDRREGDRREGDRESDSKRGEGEDRRGGKKERER